MALCGRPESKPARIADDQQIVGERGVAGPAVGIVGHAAAAVALHGYRHADRPGVAAPSVEEPRLDRDRVAGPTEALALADNVSDRHALDASREAHAKPANLGRWNGHAN